jgi:hypothetical protein
MVKTPIDRIRQNVLKDTNLKFRLRAALIIRAGLKNDLFLIA